MCNDLWRKSQAEPNKDDANAEHNGSEGNLAIGVEVGEGAANAEKEDTDHAQDDAPEFGRAW